RHIVPLISRQSGTSVLCISPWRKFLPSLTYPQKIRRNWFVGNRLREPRSRWPCAAGWFWPLQKDIPIWKSLPTTKSIDTLSRCGESACKSTVNRLWKLHNLKPHLSRTFKLSRDPKFIEKLTDVVGLYLNPPQKGIVLCVDEKSQIQALDRTQPGLPLKKGRCGTMTHDDKRNGTATLFAALNVLDGKDIGQCSGRHRHQEF